MVEIKKIPNATPRERLVRYNLCGDPDDSIQLEYAYDPEEKTTTIIYVSACSVTSLIIPDEFMKVLVELTKEMFLEYGRPIP
jgi:hypothetical protein